MFPISRLVLAFLIASVFISTAIAQRPAKVPLEKITIRVSEGTGLGFDRSPDDRTIVFDLLGQLWLVPADGGRARPITNAVRDTAEDLDPSFSPDGRSVVFRGERNGRTGLWLLNLNSDRPRQLTQLSNPDGYDKDAAWSPEGRTIAFTRGIPPSAPGSRGQITIMLLDVASGTARELSIAGLPNPQLSDPVWIRDGDEIAFVVSDRVWKVPATGGQASPVTEESVKVQAPAFAPDGRKIAYFSPDGSGRVQVWVQETAGGGIVTGLPVKITNHTDVTPTRIRWIEKGNSLLYSADGRLWKVASSGGEPREIRFSAELSITRPRRILPTAKFPEPGGQEPARGFMGLALSPDGRQIGVLALGKLWIIPVGGTPRAIAGVPFDATSLAWTPDGSEVVWTAGVEDRGDLFATHLTTGATRQITSFAGREAHPVFSPDGRFLAFVHIQGDEAVLRVVDARAAPVADVAPTRNLGTVDYNWACPPQWSPESDGLLVPNSTSPNQSRRATFVPLNGPPQTVERFPDAPIFLRWTPQHTILYIRHDRLWEAPFDLKGMLAEPKALGNAAALYASSSRDGTVLFVSGGGLRLRFADGREQDVGWPISYTPPVAESTLIKNVRVVDGTGAPATPPRDLLIEHGRIARIAAAGRLSTGGAKVIDAGGRVVMPGLMDLHAHVYRPDLLPGFLYFGVTTIRDQGSSMAPLVAYADAIAAGALPGPRVSYGGFQFYSDWSFDEEQGRGIEPEADPDHIRRSVRLSAAFGAQHIKTRTFRRWDINARMIAEAHRLGMRATGHCSHLLPLIAAGMDAKEHIGFCESRGDTPMYDDMIELFRASGVGVVPTITYMDLALRINERPTFLDGDAELAPFMPGRENFNWMINLTVPARQRWEEYARNAREGTAKLLRAGVTLGTGTDVWQIPTGVHMELEQMVAAGLTPAQAIHAGTGGAARILGADKTLGTVEVGKWADLVILDADPLADIRNTRRIWQVIQYGQLVDRRNILKVIKPR